MSWHDDDAARRAVGRVRALLAKAESTDSPAEAEALTAKAEELMLAYQISRGALLAEAEIQVMTRVFEGSLHVGWRRCLMAAADGIPGTFSLYGSSRGRSAVRVWAEDIQMTEALLSSLMVQAATGLAVWWRDELDKRDRATTRKCNYLWGFGRGVADRFALRRTALPETSSAALVLVDASRRVREHVEGMVRVTASRGSQSSTASGFAAGQHDGQSADTGERQLVTG
jgi:hypothetical protein